jgi:hypothetical protein
MTHSAKSERFGLYGCSMFLHGKSVAGANSTGGKFISSVNNVSDKVITIVNDSQE